MKNGALKMRFEVNIQCKPTAEILIFYKIAIIGWISLACMRWRGVLIGWKLRGISGVGTL